MRVTRLKLSNLCEIEAADLRFRSCRKSMASAFRPGKIGVLGAHGRESGSAHAYLYG
ncbi:MAG: hypothetical protein ACR2L2_20275 [Acidobacteriota bacterium]